MTDAAAKIAAAINVRTERAILCMRTLCRHLRPAASAFRTLKVSTQAASLGIDHRAELLPEEKQRIVLELQDSGHRVGKVGNGINDAPALAAADIGIAMSGGTDVALETADAAVLHGRVMGVANMFWLSRATMANIRQNIAIALGLKAVFLVTTVGALPGSGPPSSPTLERRYW